MSDVLRNCLGERERDRDRTWRWAGLTGSEDSNIFLSSRALVGVVSDVLRTCLGERERDRDRTRRRAGLTGSEDSNRRRKSRGVGGNRRAPNSAVYCSAHS